MDTVNNWEEDIRINPTELDVAWVMQAELFGKYSKLSALAKKRVNELEQKLKVVRSQLLLEARDNGAKNGGQEEAYYRNDPTHQAIKKEWIEAQFEADILDGAVFAFHQRKAALENLVTLQGQNYFAGPTVPRDIGNEWAKQSQRDRAREKAKNAASSRMAISRSTGRTITR